MPSLKQRCSSLCTIDCKGLRVQQEHFHTQYPRAVSVQRLEHPLREKEGLWKSRGAGGRGEARWGGGGATFFFIIIFFFLDGGNSGLLREGWGVEEGCLGAGRKRAEVGGWRNRERGNEEGREGIERRDNDK